MVSQTKRNKVLARLRRTFLTRSGNHILLKLLLLIFGLSLSGFPSLAQGLIVPGSLRVDLLRNSEKVYQNGCSVPVPLEEALRSGPNLQYCTVNSRFPLFSWNIVSGAKQWAYQVEVSTQAGSLKKGIADIWTSRRVKDDRSTAIVYSGPGLLPSKVYYWRVRIWRGKGKASDVSAVQSFSTGKKLKDFELPSFTLSKDSEAPLRVKQPDSNSVLYDFGKDAFGQAKLSVFSDRDGDTLTVHLGEKLTVAGHVDHKPPGSVRYREFKVPVNRGIQSVDLTIAPDKRNTGPKAILMPPSTGEVLPFRYLEVKGNFVSQKIHSVSRWLVSNDFNDSATIFTCSDTSLTKIWDLCKHTVKATSFTGYYIDGDRERIPYEADALINQLSHYSVDAEYTMSKRTLEYLVYHPTWPTEWSIQNVFIALNDYEYSGDLRLVNRLYPDLQNKLLMPLAREDGLISTRSKPQTKAFLRSLHFPGLDSTERLKDIVDWPHPGGLGLKPGSGGETDGFVFSNYNSVVNAYYYAGLIAMKKLAIALNKADDAALYNREAKRVKLAFQKAFIDRGSGLILDGEGVKHSSLHANLFALSFGLVPADNLAGVVSFIKSRGMACSVYPAQFLLDALVHTGEADFALHLITSRDKRSWFNMLDEGATMTMEAWGQEFKPNQDWGHAWGTAPANFIVRQVMGIQPTSAGFSKVQVKPHPGKLKNAEINYLTVKGAIKVNFKNDEGRFQLEVEIPGNTIAAIWLPFPSSKSRVWMNGRKIKASYTDGYWKVPEMPSGKYLFTVH